MTFCLTFWLFAYQILKVGTFWEVGFCYCLALPKLCGYDLFYLFLLTLQHIRRILEIFIELNVDQLKPSNLKLLFLCGWREREREREKCRISHDFQVFFFFVNTSFSLACDWMKTYKEKQLFFRFYFIYILLILSICSFGFLYINIILNYWCLFVF